MPSLLLPLVDGLHSEGFGVTDMEAASPTFRALIVMICERVEARRDSGAGTPVVVDVELRGAAATVPTHPRN
jgi:hypothetical protein